MSSEQVIAEVVAEMRSRYASATGHGASHEVVAANAVDVAAMLTRWADRLSTPAAGGDASGVAYYRQVADSAMRQSCELLKRAEAAESKLSALLDGIEGLEGQIRASSDMQLAPDYADALEDFADDLKALREKAK